MESWTMKTISSYAIYRDGVIGISELQFTKISQLSEIDIFRIKYDKYYRKEIYKNSRHILNIKEKCSKNSLCTKDFIIDRRLYTLCMKYKDFWMGDGYLKVSDL